MQTLTILDRERHCHVVVLKPENISLFLLIGTGES
jgi:hypothetical protein